MNDSPRSPVALVALALLGACASGPRAEPASEPGIDPEGAIDAWEEEHDEEPETTTTLEATHTVGIESNAGGTKTGPAAHRGGHAVERGAGATRANPIDVRFAGADLHDALRFLAEEADVSIVIADDVAGRVDLELRDVDAMEAMRIVAAAHAATIEVRDGVVYVSLR